MNKLDELLTSGATQLEIAAALPVRSWEAVRKKIVQLRGDSSMVTETGQLENGETIADYLERNPEQAVTMNFAVSENCSPRLPQNKNHHCSGRPERLNIASLSDWQFLGRLASLRDW